MDGDTTIVVAGTPDEGEPGGDIEQWQLELSETMATALREGFSELRETFQAELTTLRQSNSDLLQSNTALTQQITQANQTLMDKVTALTQPALPLVVVQEPATPEPEPNESTPSETVETAEVEAPASETRRKRRLL